MESQDELTTLSTIPRLVAKVLEINDIDPEPLFSSAGLVLAEVSQNDVRVAMSDMTKLWQLAVEATENETLGLQSASLFQPTYIKGLGLAWMASENLVEGLKLFVKNSQLVNTAFQIELESADEAITIRYAKNDHQQAIANVHRCAIQLGVGFFLRMFRIAAGKPIPAHAAYFNFPEPADTSAYETYFECPLFFDHPFNGISFSESLLMELLPTRDPELVELNRMAVEKYVKTLGSQENAINVSRVINDLLPSGCPTEEDVAYQLNMSKRTLQRRLSAESTSFGDLLNSIRMSLAKELLQTTDQQITSIAYQLGYSTPSTFARAFKQTHEATPAEFRNRH